MFFVEAWPAPIIRRRRRPLGVGSAPALSGEQVAACGTLTAASLRITRVVDDTAEHDALRADVAARRGFVDAAYRRPPVTAQTGNSPPARRPTSPLLGVYTMNGTMAA